MRMIQSPDFQMCVRMSRRPQRFRHRSKLALLVAVPIWTASLPHSVPPSSHSAADTAGGAILLDVFRGAPSIFEHGGPEYIATRALPTGNESG